MRHSLTVHIGDEGTPEVPAGQSNPGLDRWLKDGMGNYSSDQLREAFDLVRDPEHWKNDIDCVVDAAYRDILEKAVPFMVGGGVDFHPLPDGKIRVVANGYWSNGMDG